MAERLTHHCDIIETGNDSLALHAPIQSGSVCVKLASA
jgi:hypothetical protein